MGACACGGVDASFVACTMYVDIHVTPAVHCDSCAQMLLALQAHVLAAPLFASPVSVDVLRAEMWAWHDDAERRTQRPRIARPRPEL